VPFVVMNLGQASRRRPAAHSISYSRNLFGRFVLHNYYKRSRAPLLRYSGIGKQEIQPKCNSKL